MCMRACMHTLNKKPPPSCKHKNQNSDRIPTPPTRPLHDNTCFFFFVTAYGRTAPLTGPTSPPTQRCRRPQCHQLHQRQPNYSIPAAPPQHRHRLHPCVPVKA